jgi:hypothetical protein
MQQAPPIPAKLLNDVARHRHDIWKGLRAAAFARMQQRQHLEERVAPAVTAAVERGVQVPLASVALLSGALLG